MAENVYERKKLEEDLRASLNEQTILRELTGRVYAAKSEEGVLDEAIWGLRELGKEYSDISMVDESGKYITVVRSGVKSTLLAKLEKVARKIIPGVSWLGNKIPIYEDGNIFKEVYEKCKPLVTDNVALGDKSSVVIYPLANIYDSVFEKNSKLRGPILPLIKATMPYKSLILAPLIIRNKSIGDITLVSDGILTEHDLELIVTFSKIISQAIDNLRLLEERVKLLVEVDAAIAEKDYFRKIDKIKDEFIATVTHEFKTPLTSIKALAELLLSDEKKDEKTLAEALSIINNESERLARLVNDVLDLAKMEQGVVEWRIKEMFLQPIVELSIAEVKHFGRGVGLKIENKVEKDLPPVLGDEDKLIQVMVNLLSNAIKFTDEGGRVEIKARKIEGFLEVYVADTGIGIAAENLERIFERFAQVSSAQGGRPKGTGLGLHICRHIIEHHGGKIWAESELGKGSKFYFTVPLAKVKR